MAVNKIEDTIWQIKALRNDLDDFCGLLESEMDTIQDRLMQISKAGWCQEWVEQYQRNCSGLLEEEMNQIIYQIRTMHLEYINLFLERVLTYWNEIGESEVSSIN